MAQKILLIDDDNTVLTILKAALSRNGYDVTTASDGEKGLDILANFRPDLIVLDIQMPRMGGFEFMNELKEQQGFEITPVIMLTANDNMEDIFRHEGVKGYFVKPVNNEQLLAKIQECLPRQGS